MNQIAFIIHGKIRKRDKIIAAVKSVFGDTATLIFSITEHVDHASELAFNAVKDGATHVICLGGDGSLNEVTNGVMKAVEAGFGKKGRDGVQVGLLPYGTGNDFARTMGVSKDLALLKTWIEQNSFRQIDLGRTEYSDKNNVKTGRYFVNITDVGIGGIIAHNLSYSSKILGPVITYQKEILSALFSYKNQPVKVQADSFNYEKSVMSLIVANGRFFGSGMGIAPDALPDDKLFSIVIIGEISMFEYLQNLGNIKKSKKIDHPEVKYLTASEVVIESPNGPLPIDMDGEFIGYTPIKMKIIPGAVRFIAPK